MDSQDTGFDVLSSGHEVPSQAHLHAEYPYTHRDSNSVRSVTSENYNRIP